MIIALKGPAQCGKTTLANVLDAEFKYRGFKVRRTAFSDFVREEINGAFMDVVQYNQLNHELPPWVNECFITIIENPAMIPKGFMTWLIDRPAHPDSRKLQQWWGQDYRRPQDPLYWIKQSFEANVEYLLDPDYIVIEESCRQENEGRYVHALGGIVLDLKPLAPPTESEAAAMSHSVEQAALSWDGDFEIDMSKFFAMEDSEQMEWTRRLVSNLLDRMEPLTV